MKPRTFQFIFCGSTMERHGVPLLMSHKSRCCPNSIFHSPPHALHTDLDVMFCSVADRACFSGEGNILVEPFVNETGGFTGYATLSSLAPGDETYSNVFRDMAKRSVEDASVTSLPGVPCCCGSCEVCVPKITLHSKGPALKITILPLFEVDTQQKKHFWE